MSSVVALSWIPVKKDAEGSDGSQALQSMKDKILATPGFLHAYHGKSADPKEPTSIEMIQIWSSLDAAKAAQSTPEAAQAKAAFDQITDTSNPAVTPHHNIFVFDKDFVPVADTPIVQMTTMFFPPTVSTADFEAAWNNGMKSFSGVDGWIAGTHGWALQEFDHPVAGKKKVFMAAAGWESIEKAVAGGEKVKGGFEGLEKFGQQVSARFTSLTKVK